MATRTAFDVVWNDKRKMYQLIQIDYNYISKKTEIKRAINLAENEPMAIYKAKEMVVKNIMSLKDNNGLLVQTVKGQEEADNQEEVPKTTKSSQDDF